MNGQNEYYLIKHLMLFTGLTDRTIRNYISSRILKGEKIEGIWHFTPEEVEEFIHHPAVRPSILAKHNALVYDHLLDTDKPHPAACVILDIPGGEQVERAKFFCYRIGQGGYEDIRFYYDHMGKISRFILSGDSETVFGLLDEYRQEFPDQKA